MNGLKDQETHRKYAQAYERLGLQVESIRLRLGSACAFELQTTLLIVANCRVLDEKRAILIAIQRLRGSDSCLPFLRAALLCRILPVGSPKKLRPVANSPLTIQTLGSGECTSPDAKNGRHINGGHEIFREDYGMDHIRVLIA